MLPLSCKFVARLYLPADPLNGVPVFQTCLGDDGCLPSVCRVDFHDDIEAMFSLALMISAISHAVFDVLTMTLLSPRTDVIAAGGCEIPSRSKGYHG